MTRQETISRDDIRVAPVTGGRGMRQFLDVPERIYENDPNWIPPLRSEVRKMLDRKRNPFFEHGDARLWLAWRGDTPVGRISAQINRLHLDLHKDATGNFGFLEAIDDQAVFDRLLATAEEWLRDQGMQRVIGPYSPTMNDEIGFLISGFDTPPMVMMPHSPRYYPERLERAGYRKAKDLHAYRLVLREIDAEMLARVARVTERLRSEGRIAVRHLDMSRFEADMQLVLDVYNDAWRDNWGFLPVTAAEARQMIAQLKPLIRAEQVVFSLVDGNVVGVVVCIPDFNEIIADLGGRLLPFGWIKLLWRIRRGAIKSVRAILTGIRLSFRDTIVSGALTSLMLQEILKGCEETGIERVEFSWILEDNKASIAIAHSGASLAKIYRIYGKTLAAPPAKGA